MMKKILSAAIVVIIAITLGFNGVISASAATSAKATFNDVAARKGDTIEIIVTLSNCPQIKSMAVDPIYDTERLEYISGSWLIGNAILSDWNQKEQNGVILFSSETDVNGDIAKFVLKLTNNESWEDINFSCNVVLKNGDNTIDIEVEALNIFIICDHEWSNEIYTKNATCIKEGYTYKLCAICKREDKLKDIAKIPHTASDWIIDKESTINEEGSRHKQCVICGEMLEEETIPVLGQCNHVWSEELFINKPTRSQPGTVYRKCQICGDQFVIFNLDKLGAEPWLVAVISIGASIGGGLIALLIIMIVRIKRRRKDKQNAYLSSEL